MKEQLREARMRRRYLGVVFLGLCARSVGPLNVLHFEDGEAEEPSVSALGEPRCTLEDLFKGIS